MDAAKGVVLPVRVLLVADVSAEKLLGGAERMLKRHARALAGMCDLTLLTRQPDPDASLAIELTGGVTEYRLPFSGDRGVAGMRQLMQGAKDWWRQHQDGFDAVVAEQPFVMWALLRAGCDLPRLQVCYAFAFEEYATRHGLDWGFRHRMVGAAMRRLEGKLYASADRLLVLSDYTKHRLAECFPAASCPVDIACGGVDTLAPVDRKTREMARKQLGWQGPVVVTLRNLVPRTGVDMLVQAAVILRHTMPDLRWCVMGEGALMEALKWLAEQLDVADRIEFTGYLPEDEVALRMQAADAFMLPTRSLEGFGLVTVEANAHGLPVVATPVGANPEVAGASSDNILTETTTPDALAEATRLLFERHVDHMERAGRLHTHINEHFNWKLHDHALIHAVKSLI